MFNLAYRRRYSDLCYGYNVFWRSCLPVLRLDAATPEPSDGAKLWGDGFEIETLIHVRVALAGLRVAEVPSYEYPRLHGVSNLNATRTACASSGPWPPNGADGARPRAAADAAEGRAVPAAGANDSRQRRRPASIAGAR